MAWFAREELISSAPFGPRGMGHGGGVRGVLRERGVVESEAWGLA